jgi:hypothetical protein
MSPFPLPPVAVTTGGVAVVPDGRQRHGGAAIVVGRDSKLICRARRKAGDGVPALARINRIVR